MSFQKKLNRFILERFKPKFLYLGLLFLAIWSITSHVLGATGLASEPVTVTVLMQAPEAREWQSTLSEFEKNIRKLI